jgi:hypothetical protein
MPSIFIWKSDKPCSSNKTIKYYSGSNWVLEDNDNYSKSYMYLEQIVISGFNDSVITFNIKKMPQDWVGSELLEVSTLPYQYIKSDNYGTLEQIGNWMRFTLNGDIEYTNEKLEEELIAIKKWMLFPLQPVKPNQTYTHSKNWNNKNYQQKSNNLNKNTYQKHKSYDTLNTNKIESDFKQFLSQYNMNLMTNITRPILV